MEMNLFMVKLIIFITNRMEMIGSNFPTSFCFVFMGHAQEIARRCVQPPLNKKAIPKNAPPFQPKPSLLQVTNFLIEHVHRYPTQDCPVCKSRCFPKVLKSSIEIIIILYKQVMINFYYYSEPGWSHSRWK